MRSSNNNEGSMDREILRIALGAEATRAFRQMASRLKATNDFVKIQPSQFISYIVGDYFDSYFDKDMEVLVAEFFDAQAFYEHETKTHKGVRSFEEVMDSALLTVKKIKSKRRRKVVKRSETQPTLDSSRE